MKFAKALLSVLSLLAASGLVFAQPADIVFYYLPQNLQGENNDPLHYPCGPGGTPFPMGTNVLLFWDANGNGPDPADQQPALGGGEGEVTANAWPINQGDGYFATDPALHVGSVPEAGLRYYLEINSNNTCWHSQIFIVTPGMTLDSTLDDSWWTCTTGACNHQGNPPNAPTNFVISDTIGCLSLVARWQHDGLGGVSGFNVYREPNVFIANSPANQLTVQFEVNSTDTFNYFVRAVNGVGESPNSNVDAGASYLIRFAPGDPGRLCGPQPRGATFTIHLDIPEPQCPSGLELYLWERGENPRLLCRDSLVSQMTCTLPNEDLDSSRLMLVDSAFYRSFEDTLIATCWFWNPNAADERAYLTPERFELGQNYPNPFNPVTDIAFSVPFETEVRVEIFNLSGQLVRTLVSGSYPMGVHHASWDGISDNGFSVGTGLYLYRMTAPGFVQTNKMLLIK